MQLLFDYTEKRALYKLLRDFQRNKFENVKKVHAAIAYNYSSILIDSCIKNNISMDWWCLFNSNISTEINLLITALKSPNIKVYPISKFYHPKLIYFEGYGLYLGSANMTEKALMRNVEIGIFIKEQELTLDHKNELFRFFDYLKGNSVAMTKEDIKKLKNFQKSKLSKEKEIEEIQTQIDKEFNKEFFYFNNLLPGNRQFDGDKENAEPKKRKIFYKEWRSVQNELSHISQELEKFKMPNWIAEDAPISIITDRFLHAYYETYVLENEIFKSSDKAFKRNIEKINYFYSKNRNNYEKALNDAISWWEDYDTPQNNEDNYTNIWAIENKQILSKLQDFKYKLSSDDLYKVFLQNHAASTHARQMDNSYFGLAEGEYKPTEERVQLYVKKIITMKTAKGLDINDVIRYLLFNEEEPIEKRVYNLLNEKKYHLDHFGKSIIGELAGWGRPDTCFLRNNRVNKALRCLGFDVELY